jgi:RimJ/RimL family protein N-acetyltransferase
MTPFLVGEKVYLRGVELADAAAVQSWFNRPEVRRGTRQYLPRNLRSHEERIERMTTDDSTILTAVVLREDDRLVGLCGLHEIDARNHHAEMGLVIGDPADWGRGLGADAARLMVGYGFDTVNLNRIWLEVYEDNPAARRIYERLGFKLEGTLRQHGFRDGRWWDIHYMGLLAHEWRKKS